MTGPDQTLAQFAERTAQAIAGVLETYAPGAVSLGAATVLASKPEDPLSDFPAPYVATNVAYVDGVTGGNVLAITVAGAKRLAAAIMGGDPAAAETEGELDELELSALSEAMNQMMAAAAGATSEVLGTEVGI